MKKIFSTALIELVLFDEKDIIATSGLESSVESSTEEATVFVPGSDGFHGEELPLN